MPRYKVRLDDPDSDEFRVTVLSAKDRNEARALAERRERRFVDYTLTDEQLAAAELSPEEAEEQGVVRPGKAALLLHAQAKPYEVVAVAKRGEKFDRSDA